MKSIFILAVVVLAAVQADEKYSTENDDLDIEAVVTDPTTLKSFNGCFLGTEPCNPVSEGFKKDVPEAVTTACAKCTDAQKHIFKRFLEVLKEKDFQGYQAFKNKFDPENKHFADLEKFIASS